LLTALHSGRCDITATLAIQGTTGAHQTGPHRTARCRLAESRGPAAARPGLPGRPGLGRLARTVARRRVSRGQSAPWSVSPVVRQPRGQAAPCSGSPVLRQPRGAAHHPGMKGPQVGGPDPPTSISGRVMIRQVTEPGPTRPSSSGVRTAVPPASLRLSYFLHPA
jgi:hypothetical protein